MVTSKRKSKSSLLEDVKLLSWQVNLALMVGLFLLLKYLPLFIEAESPIIQEFMQAAPNLAPFVALFFLLATTLSVIKRVKEKKHSETYQAVENSTKQDTVHTLRTPVAMKDPSKKDTGKLNEVIESSFFIHTSSINIQPVYMSLELIQSIEWKRFEELCKAYIEIKGGNKAKTTWVGANGGVDLGLYKEGSDKSTALIQCKAWSTKKVGIGPVREFYEMMVAEGAKNGIFMITHVYSQEAIAFAKGKKLLLLSGNGLIQDILNMPEDQQAHLLEVATEGDYLTPSCPKCDIKLVRRKASKSKGSANEFWGCKNHPICKHKSFTKKHI